MAKAISADPNAQWLTCLGNAILRPQCSSSANAFYQSVCLQALFSLLEDLALHALLALDLFFLGNHVFDQLPLLL